VQPLSQGTTDRKDSALYSRQSEYVVRVPCSASRAAYSRLIVNAGAAPPNLVRLHRVPTAPADRPIVSGRNAPRKCSCHPQKLRPNLEHGLVTTCNVRSRAFMSSPLTFLTALLRCLRTTHIALLGLGRLVFLAAASRSALAAENLFLRKQLALYQERKVKPHRAENSTRWLMAALSRLCSPFLLALVGVHWVAPALRRRSWKLLTSTGD